MLMVFEILSTLLLTPFLIGCFGESEYGVYKLSASIIAYLALLDLGIGNSIVRYTAKYNEHKDAESMNRFLGVTQTFYAIMAALALILGAVLVLIFPSVYSTGLTDSEIQLGQKLLAITCANTAFTLLTAAYPNMIIGLGMFGVSKGISIVQIVVRVGASALALSLGYRSIVVVTINLITTLLGRLTAALFVFVKLRYKPIFRGIHKKFVIEIVGYSGWIMLQMTATQINAFADQVLLGIFVPGASVIIGVYAVGSQVVQYFQSIGGSVSGVLMPGVVTLVEQKATPADLEKEMVKIGRLSMIILSTIFGGFLVFGKQFIILWAGDSYEYGYYVALILMLAHLFIQVESIGSQILWAKNEHKEQAILKICIVLVNILLTIALIKWNPLIGATIGTFVSLILGDVFVMNLVFKRKIGIGLIKYYLALFKGIVPAIGVSILASFAFRIIGLNGWIGFIINVFVYCVIAASMLWLFGMNKYEKGLIKNLFGKIIKIQKRSE